MFPNISGWELTQETYNMSYVELSLNSNWGNYLTFKTHVVVMLQRAINVLSDCIVLKGWSLLSNALRSFQIYCAPRI